MAAGAFGRARNCGKDGPFKLGDIMLAVMGKLDCLALREATNHDATNYLSLLHPFPRQQSFPRLQKKKSIAYYIFTLHV